MSEEQREESAEKKSTTVVVDLLRDLLSSIEDEDYGEVVELSPRILQGISANEEEEEEEDNAAALRAAVYEIYLTALLQTGRYEKALQVIDGSGGGDVPAAALCDTAALKAYAVYRQGDYSHAAALTKEGKSAAERHVYAQSLHHLAQKEQAVEAFFNLLDTVDAAVEERVQVLTNLTAVLNAHAVPYGRSIDEEYAGAARYIDAAQSVLDSSDERFPYDLAYNLATWELFSGRREGLDLLRKAVKACREQNLDNEEELMSELAPIQTNLDLFSGPFWSGAFPPEKGETEEDAERNGSVEDDSLPSTVKTVRAVNRSLGSPDAGLELLGEEPPEKFSPLQKHLWYYNRAVLQLRAGKTKDCLSTCHFLEQQLLSGKKKKKQRQSELAVTQIEDHVWWESRLAVLQAHCRRDASALGAALTKLRGLPPSPIRDHALTYIELHRAALSDEPSSSRQTVELLQQQLPVSVRSKPAVLATTASLYHEAGESDRAAAVLRSANDSAVQADFMMSQGRYDEAAALYEKAVDESDPSSTARLVRALSYTDPSRAAKLWSEISPELVTEEEDGVDGADLEVKELPRLKTVRKSEILSQQQEVKSKKSHGAVLRRRARKREEYLTALQERGLYSAERPTQPDPERWIPKYERASAGRRRRRRPPHKGAQGGLSDKDAAKLDVAARQQAAKAGVVDSKSTAHMKVAGGGKGGRRR